MFPWRKETVPDEQHEEGEHAAGNDLFGIEFGKQL